MKNNPAPRKQQPSLFRIAPQPRTRSPSLAFFSPSPLLDLRLFVKKPGTSNDGTGGADPIPQAQSRSSATWTDWIGSTINGERHDQRDSGVSENRRRLAVRPPLASTVSPAPWTPRGRASARASSSFYSATPRTSSSPSRTRLWCWTPNLPVRRAFHACYEQGIAGAPLWDERARAFVGMIGAGDFIDITQTIGNDARGAGGERAELDAHTIATVREEQGGRDWSRAAARSSPCARRILSTSSVSRSCRDSWRWRPC